MDKVLNLDWVADAVRHTYSGNMGRKSIPPETAVRLMLAGFLLGIVKDRRLMREAQVNLAIRWFADLDLDDEVPDHSSFTRIRQRWGEKLFREIFLRGVKACNERGLLSGESVHIDATFIRADASLDSLVDEHVDSVIRENDSDEAEEKKTGKETKRKKVCATDPDATMARSRRGDKFEPRYKQHTAVDDKCGVIVDIGVTTGKANEGVELIGQVERVEENTGKRPARITADAGYASGENYRRLEEMGVEPVIPPRPEKAPGKSTPKRKFKYDSMNHVVKCPGGKKLRRTTRDAHGWYYVARTSDCQSCALKEKCVPPSQRRRKIQIVFGGDALLRARRGRLRARPENIEAMSRHKWMVEGRHGEAKEQHGLRRAVRRGTAEVAIQVYLTAVAMNLKRLAAFICALRAGLRVALEACKRLRCQFPFVTYFSLSSDNPPWMTA